MYKQGWWRIIQTVKTPEVKASLMNPFAFSSAELHKGESVTADRDRVALTNTSCKKRYWSKKEGKTLIDIAKNWSCQWVNNEVISWKDQVRAQERHVLIALHTQVYCLTVLDTKVFMRVFLFEGNGYTRIMIRIGSTILRNVLIEDWTF